ncbi:MAG TPA: nitrogenase component 1 [Methanomassiliicoccales archaeon]|jgi:nitrogenase molybdenum-iron protein beta chain
MYSVVAIPGVVPIADSGPGCADKQYTSLAHMSGYQGSGRFGGAIPPSVNATQEEVVFGGAEKLRQLIQASVKVLDGDLYVVTTGCIADIVGDDVGAVVEKFQKKGVPVVYAATGGFKGNNFIGHESIAKAIIDQYVGDYSGEREQGLVNVWAVLPYQDVHWRGDLAEIKRILEGIGLKVNILFGNSCNGVSEWRSIPRAQFNLVISSWYGLSVAEHLNEKYGQPYLHIPSIPIGSLESRKFLETVSEFAGLDPKRTEEFVTSEETEFYKYLEQFSDFYSEYWWGIPSRFAVVTDSSYGLAITRFAVNQLGLIPSLVIATENPPEEYREMISNEFRHISDDISLDLKFIEDGYHISSELKNSAEKPAMIFGTTWDRYVAKELKATVVEVSFPASYEVVLSGSYVGYRGALLFMEKIFTTAISGSA